jgi:hypothetical protein
MIRLTRPRRVAATLVALAVTAGAAACTPSDATSGTSTLLALDSVPVLDLGDEAKGPQEEFSGTVIPVRLSDGTIVVANGGSQELRFFETSGAFRKSVGRDGEGPGEFRRLGWLHAGPGDTLRTWDWSLVRMEVFAPDGSHQRTMALGSPKERVSVSPVGMLDDGSIIMSTQANVDFSTKDGVIRDTTTVLRYDVAGRLADSLGTFSGSEAWVVHSQVGTSRGVSVSNRPFGKALTVVTHGNMVTVGNSDAPELTVLRADGSTRRTVRWETAVAPVTAEDIAAYKAMSAEGWPAGMEARRDRALARLENAPFPETKPAYSRFLVSSDGSYWVQRYSMRADGAGTTFDVFDSTGARRGECEMPARFTPAQVTPEFVLGTWKDADDVVHVRMYRFAGTR